MTRLRRQHADVVAEIGAKIVGGEFAVGEILPREEELVQQLAVSRSVVREAMRVLASKGLVEARPKRGTQVRPESAWRQLDPDILTWRVSQGSTSRFLQDVADLREMIEPAAAAYAAERATDIELDLIAGLAREMEYAEGDEPSFIEADLRFHRALLQAAHNDLLMQVAAAIETGLRLSREVTVGMGHSSRVAEHADVAAAVQARSASRARRAMQNLIRLGAEDIETVLGSHTSIDRPG